MSLGGGTNTVQTTTQKLAPEQQQLLKFVIPVAQQFVQNPPQQYSGSAIEPLNQQQLSAQQQMLGAAGNINGFTSQIPQELQSILGGFGNNVAQNQATAAGSNAQLQQLMSMLNGSINYTTGQLGQSFGNVANNANATTGNIYNFLGQGNANTAPALNFLTSGAVMNPNANPALQQATAAAIQPYIQQFQTQIIPGLRESSIANGAFGGTRNQIAEGLAAQGLEQQAGNITANMANNAYNQGLNAFTQGIGQQIQQTGQNVQGALSSGQLTQDAANTIMQGILQGGNYQSNAFQTLLNSNLQNQSAQNNASATQQNALSGAGNILGNAGNTLQASLLPSELTSAVGEQNYNLAQQQLTEQVQKFINEQLIPFSAAQDVAAMAFGIPAGSTQTNASTSGSTMGGLSQILGLASAGLGLASSPLLAGLFK